MGMMWGYPKWIGNLCVVIVLEICWEDINIKLPIDSVYICIYVCIVYCLVGSMIVTQVVTPSTEGLICICHLHMHRWQ